MDVADRMTWQQWTAGRAERIERYNNPTQITREEWEAGCVAGWEHHTPKRAPTDPLHPNDLPPRILEIVWTACAEFMEPVRLTGDENVATEGRWVFPDGSGPDDPAMWSPAMWSWAGATDWLIWRYRIDPDLWSSIMEAIMHYWVGQMRHLIIEDQCANDPGARAFWAGWQEIELRLPMSAN